MQIKNFVNTVKEIATGKRGVHFRDTDCTEELIYPEEKFSMPEFLDIEGKPHPFFDPHEATVPPFYVRSLKNGICYTPAEEVYTSDGRVILDHNIQKTAQPIRWRRFLGNVTRLKGKVAHLNLSGLENNYYHWLLECLGRLHLIRKSGFQPDLYVVSNALNFQKQWLELLGIQERQIVPANAGTTVQADELIVPSLLNNWETVEFRGHASYQKQWLPHWICDLYSKFRLEGGGGKKIYISRTKASYRKIVNEDSLLPLLDKYGFTVIHSETLSVREQIEAFANAKAVVGLHGAGLVNCILCPPHTPVLEIYPQYYHDSSFRVLFSVANLRHFYMMGETFDTSGYPGHENASIDLKKFEMALKILVS